MEKHPLHIKNPELQTSPEVERAVKRQERRAKTLALELCPSATGPNYRLQYLNQPLGEYTSVAMKPIAARVDSPRVFNLGRGGGKQVRNLNT